MSRFTSTFSQVKDFRIQQPRRDLCWGKGTEERGVEQEMGREGRTELQSGYFRPPAWKTHSENPRSSKPGALRLGGTPVTGFIFLVKNLAVRRCLKYASAEAFLLPKQTSTFVERTFKRKKPIIYKRQHIYMYAADLGEGLGPIEKYMAIPCIIRLT